MRQLLGYLMILCLFPLLFVVGDKIWEEAAKAQNHKEQIQEQIKLPEIKNSFLLKC
ncbi:hypothetical protein [Ureibacillus thermosphaericus]|uniref:hypothetical protein n=1 Tax=Ureibacillus thermosphaericus TaxID=51173 RepID=UPI001E4B5C47|nr:hypothetical protein [Ureibacillus thermosphaericus]